MAYTGPHISHRKFTPEQDAEIAKLRQTGTTLSSLCRQFGGSLPAMRHSLERSGVATGKTGRPKWRTFTPEQIADMAALWESGESQTFIAKRYGTTQTIISGVLKQEGVEVATGRWKHLSGPNHPNWKGGTITISGYRAVILERGSPLASMTTTNQGYVLEHRLVMAQSLGRPLTPNETVHHINGDRTDNRIENLQLRQGKHGKHQVFVCADCGSHNVIGSPLD